MSYTYTELYESRKCDLTKDGFIETRVYHVVDPSLSHGEQINCEDVINDVKDDSRFRMGAEVPGNVLSGIYCTGVSVMPTGSPGIARMEVKYESREKTAATSNPVEEPDLFEIWEFTAGTQKTKLTNSSHLGYWNYGVGESSTIAGGVIGLKDDGSVEGVEYEEPIIGIKVTKIYKSLDESTLRTIALAQNAKCNVMTATINDRAWFGFETNCVLFSGAVITKRKLYEWQYEYNFVYHHPLSGEWTLTDGTSVVLTGVGGHDVIDFQHDKTVNAEGFTTYSIRNIGIRRLYKESNFADLGLLGV